MFCSTRLPLKIQSRSKKIPKRWDWAPLISRRSQRRLKLLVQIPVQLKPFVVRNEENIHEYLAAFCLYRVYQKKGNYLRNYFCIPFKTARIWKEYIINFLSGCLFLIRSVHSALFTVCRFCLTNSYILLNNTFFSFMDLLLVQVLAHCISFSHLFIYLYVNLE